ncbi:MAG TPA: ribosome silencing factor [Panacibacter sp.]|nr:ribosome silencing factor [Panacibacter sp.]HNP42785.1 ribosome silencing factor [Panacibacter sp.]
METLSVLANRKKPGSSKLTRNSKVYKSVLKALAQKKAENIISLDLRKIPEAVADFFIICEATSTTQIKAIADNVQEVLRVDCDENPYRHEGSQSLHWVLIDYVNIVIHVMQPETRKFYKLEELWSDAALTEHNEV